MDASKTLYVRVVNISRNPLDGARVQLLGANESPVELRLDKRTRLHWTEIAQRGSFILSVSAEGCESQERPVQLPHPPTPVEFVLGKTGLPFYFRGKVKTPFEPKPQLIGVTVDKEKDAGPKVDRIAANLGLVEEQTHQQVRRNNVRVFRYPDHLTAEERERAFHTVRLASGVRLAGPVVEMFELRAVLLTNQFVVTFLPEVTNEQVQKIAQEYQFKVVRGIAVANNAFLFEGEPKADYSLLDVANELATRKDVDYVEPNAISTSIPFQIKPTDSLWAQQWHIPLINLPTAWQTLHDKNPLGVEVGEPGDRTFGDANIHIVVFDTGIQTTTEAGVAIPSHPEFQGKVTSGAAKVAALYDFAEMVPNNDSATKDDHGMRCAGVATAQANNPSLIAGEGEGVAGAAGNCRVIGICAPFGQPNLRWADALLWMAGFDPGWLDDGVTYPIGTKFPDKLAHGADVYTCSIRIPDFALMDAALDFLASFGREGRGIVSFLAAGNADAPISNENNNTIADHDKVIAVAASINVDVRSGYSCFDATIDLCAPSDGNLGQLLHGTPRMVTTSAVGVGNLAGKTGGPLNYTATFGGTSAATALAAGVGALMLSINPDLTWAEVRDILCTTAKKIDAGNTDAKWTKDAAGNPVFSPWYGFGRVDAAAAVIGARDFPKGSAEVIRSEPSALPSAGRPS